MKHYRTARRQSADGRYRWRVDDLDGKELAVAQTQAKADAVASGLNRERELRVLLAWRVGDLAATQARAMLGLWVPADATLADVEARLRQMVGSCLKELVE